jgi:hypothetical protein
VAEAARDYIKGMQDSEASLTSCHRLDSNVHKASQKRNNQQANIQGKLF